MVVNETVQYYTENGGKPVYVLLLDASKAFDKVAFNVLFNKLRDRSMCPRITKLLHHMYTNQSCYVKWGNEHCRALTKRSISQNFLNEFFV